MSDTQIKDALKKWMPTDPHLEAYETYLTLLKAWAQVYNLTTIVDPEEMVIKHVLDSLSISPYLVGKRFIDVGTGAGLPGMVLAIAHPEQHWILLDAVQKKTHFLQAVKAKLKLNNIEIVHARVESYRCDPLCDGVVTRAFSDLSTMLTSTQHLCQSTGMYYAMKGRHPDEELVNIPNNYHIEKTIPLQVPGLNAERQLIVISETITKE
jgi:16S rRNA (guanine527-N7)-methyltransferase